jgi:hypothetical protein
MKSKYCLIRNGFFFFFFFFFFLGGGYNLTLSKLVLYSVAFGITFLICLNSTSAIVNRFPGPEEYGRCGN